MTLMTMNADERLGQEANPSSSPLRYLRSSAIQLFSNLFPANRQPLTHENPPVV